MNTGRILLVEDDPGIRRFLRVALEAQGFTLEEAASGKDGIARAATAQPDLVVLDLGLPDMDGKAVITRVREWSDVPILILSVRQAEEEKVAALEAEIVHGDLRIDLPRHEVTLAGEPVRLTRKEFDLLVLLARNAGRIVTHRQLLADVWGPAHEHDLQYLRVFIGRLRAKLGDDPTAPRFILNEPGVGYRFLE